MIPPYCISITGSIEADELAELVATIRRIDERHPDRLYSIVIRGGPEADGTLEDAERLMRAALPEAPNRHVVITVHRTKHAP